MSKAPKSAKAESPQNEPEPPIDESSIMVDDGTPAVDDLKMPEQTHQSRWARFKHFIATHRTRTILVIGVLILASTGAYAYYASTKPITIKEAEVLPRPEKPKTKASPLTGIQIAPEQADRPILAVVIENHPDARPQSGLSQAGVVYEALAEGGITRFLAFFLDERPANIGPVRSLRTYFVDWALEFNAPVAHVGGNAAALDLVGPTGLKDINQFYNGNSFFRTKDRIAPHNAYTNSDLMDALLKKNGWDQPANFKVSPRQNDAPSKNPLHPNITITYSYSDFQVEYKYDASCNCYNRFLAGQPHIDRNTGQQIKVKNVVVEYMPTSYGKSRIGEQMTIMGTPGSGKAVVFRDGEAFEGTWGKSEHKDRTKLIDAAGKEIPLNRGNTWYSIVPTDKTVSY